MTGGGPRPLLVAGVAGGVGTSTLIRLLQATIRFPVAEKASLHDRKELDLLVTSNTVASAANLGACLELCPCPPLLVVMHVAAGVIRETRPYLRASEPHITARFDIEHRRDWLAMDQAPGTLPLHGKDIDALLAGLPAALRAMYTLAPRRPPSPSPSPIAAASPVSSRASPRSAWSDPRYTDVNRGRTT